MTQESDQKKWGGHREGAGRKPSGKRRAVFWVTDQEEKHLRNELTKLREESTKEES